MYGLRLDAVVAVHDSRCYCLGCGQVCLYTLCLTAEAGFAAFLAFLGALVFFLLGFALFGVTKFIPHQSEPFVRCFVTASVPRVTILGLG